MPGLLDHIFDNINIEELERSEVLNYLTYLSEIANQNLTLEKKIKFLAIKIQLNHRLLQLDKNINNRKKELYTSPESR